MKINPQTGILSSFSELSCNIEYMVENYQKFSPRNWISKESGSYISTKKLNNLLIKIAQENKENWVTDIVEKINSPNLNYKDSTISINVEELLYPYKRDFQLKKNV